MNLENVFLALAVAAATSIALCLALSWTSPVVIIIAGVSVFSLVLYVGWQEAGAAVLAWANVWDFADLWLWLALFVWFALLSYFWLWMLCAALIFVWLTRAWRSRNPVF